uniref:ribosomal protein L23 n=1 Tax=Ochrosphaera neapolitana TaxID=35137 RepID=UPI00286C3C3F|nr:ribosomal protein L23 [Ochrosphaera neapolitana]WKK50135.1 ribosomal protein L23 [Ochrosphaera neapolitana]
MNSVQESLIDLLKYPLLTEKTIRLLEQNQYSFAVPVKADKGLIKTAVESLFDVKVLAVNTSIQPIKKRRVGRFFGKKAQVKRAIVTLSPEDSITFFEKE